MKTASCGAENTAEACLVHNEGATVTTTPYFSNASDIRQVGLSGLFVFGGAL